MAPCAIALHTTSMHLVELVCHLLPWGIACGKGRLEMATATQETTTLPRTTMRPATSPPTTLPPTTLPPTTLPPTTLPPTTLPPTTLRATTVPREPAVESTQKATTSHGPTARAPSVLKAMWAVQMALRRASCKAEPPLHDCKADVDEWTEKWSDEKTLGSKALVGP